MDFFLATSNIKKAKEIQSLANNFNFSKNAFPSAPNWAIDAQGDLSRFRVLPLPSPFVYPQNHPHAGQTILPPSEPFFTFIENALHKARYYAGALMSPVIAEDSGLCVPALKGAPGVFSARFAELPTNPIAQSLAEPFAEPFADQFNIAPKNPQTLQKTVKDSVPNDTDNHQKLLEKMADINNRSAFYACYAVAIRHAEDPSPLIAQGFWHGEIARQPMGENGFGYDPIFFIPALGKTAAQISPEEKSQRSHRGQTFNALFRLIAEANRD